MLNKRILIVCLAVFSCNGCVHKRQGYSQASDYYRSMMSSYLSDPAWYKQYYVEQDPEKKKELRDKIIGYCIWLVDENYNRYVDKFSRNQTRNDLIADWSSLALSGASTVATPAAIYGAISTGIQGAHAAYSRDALDQQTRSAVVLEMDTLREDRLATIWKSEELPDSQYSLVQGLIDVQYYVNAGTVHAALAAISQNASVQHQATAQALKAVRK